MEGQFHFQHNPLLTPLLKQSLWLAKEKMQSEQYVHNVFISSRLAADWDLIKHTITMIVILSSSNCIPYWL